TRDGLHRIWAPYDTAGFGPLNGPLDNRIEVTFGYNPLSLSRYNRYLESANANPKILDSLGVTAKLNKDTGVFEPNPAALPRIYAPQSVVAAGGPEEATRRLPMLDPSKQAVAEGVASIAQNGPAQVRVTKYSENEYRATYQAAGPTFLRV